MRGRLKELESKEESIKVSARWDSWHKGWNHKESEEWGCSWAEFEQFIIDNGWDEWYEPRWDPIWP